MLALAHVLEKRSVKRKTLIISKGVDATEMYFVVRGEASVLRAPNDPAEQAVATISSSTEEDSAWCAPFLPTEFVSSRTLLRCLCFGMVQPVRRGRCSDRGDAQCLYPR
eukprot:COSAG02_NODE_1299_length_13382_cov_14.723858_8_plen_109_part_00